MDQVQTFLTDWLPSLAVIVGSVWIFLNWLLQRGKDERRNVAALFGEVTIDVSPLSETKCFVVVKSDWENTSPTSIPLDPHVSRIELFGIEDELSVGVYQTSRQTADIITSHLLFEGFSRFAMEPNAKSRVQTNYVLERGKIYLVRIILYLDPVIEGKPGTLGTEKPSLISLQQMRIQSRLPTPKSSKDKTKLWAEFPLSAEARGKVL